MGILSNRRVVDPVLTELSMGYENEEFVADLIFPEVSVEKEEGKIPKFGKESFKIYDTARAVGGDSNRIKPTTRNTTSYILEEDDLEYPIDIREQEESIIDEEAFGTDLTIEGLRLKKEKTAADIAQNDANYPSGHKVTLSGTTKWSATTTSTPLVDIATGHKAIRTAISKKANLAIMGPDAFDCLKEHPTLVEKVKYSMKGVLTQELVKEIIDVDNLAVGYGVYVDDAGVSHQIWGDTFILVYVPQLDKQKRSKYRPSFGYTFQKKGYPQVDTYQENGGKTHLVRSTDVRKTMITGSDAGYIIKDVK